MAHDAKDMPPMHLDPKVAQERIDDLHEKVSELKRDKAWLKSKLGKAVEALKEIAEEERIDHLMGGLCSTDGGKLARTTLAELKEGTD